MPWFKVDDGLHAHRKAARAGVEAMGLWVLAGSWSADQLTDGFVPDYIAAKLDPKAKTHARRLCDAGLWEVAERDGDRGWQFHQWTEQQPEAKVTLAKRAEAKDRMQRIRDERKANRHRNALNGSAIVRANDPGTFAERSPEIRSTPTRPDPSRPELPSEVLKPLVVQAVASPTKQDHSEVENPSTDADESELPARLRKRKVWCPEHHQPNDRDCLPCQQDHGDRAYHAKRRERGET